MLPFHKYQALGNDYIVVAAPDLSPAAVRRICQPHFGLGGDGVLLPGGARDGAPFSLRIFNPDGSRAEKSGNGLRIFARYLYDSGQVDNAPFRLATDGGPVEAQVSADGSVRVDLGRVTVAPAPLTLSVAGRALTAWPASVGNPHCVVIWPQPPVAADATLYGPPIERDAAFARRTNVQLVHVTDRQTLHLQIWERGAGYTLASGSSSCAAVAVAHRLGLCDAAVQVVMPGGTLAVTLAGDGAATISGPVTRIACGQIDPAIFAAPDLTAI